MKRLLKMGKELIDPSRPKTRQDVREAARKPKGAPSGRLANLKKALKRPKKGLAGFKSKLSKSNPLSAGGGKTYIVNGKLVSKQKFLEAKRKSPSHQGALARRKIGMARLPKRKKK